MPRTGRERHKNPRYPVADALPGIDSAADIFTLREKRGGGPEETIHRLRGQEAFGDLALSDLAEDDSLQTR